MPRPLDLAYWLLASLSIAVIPLGSFAGLPVLRMAPTVLLAGMAWAGTRQHFGVTMGLGLFLGAWGDYFLSTFDPDLAPLGVIAFLLGHLSYIAGLRRVGWQTTPGRRAVVAGLVAFGASYGSYIAWVNPLQPVSHLLWFDLQPAPQLLPVAPALLLYMPWLIGMASVAVLRRGSRRLAAGALVFVASDALIPLNQFLLPRPAGAVCASNWLMFAGFVTYYAAQFWIAKGALDEARPIAPRPDDPGPQTAPPA